MAFSNQGARPTGIMKSHKVGAANVIECDENIFVTRKQRQDLQTVDNEGGDSSSESLFQIPGYPPVAQHVRTTSTPEPVMSTANDDDDDDDSLTFAAAFQRVMYCLGTCLVHPDEAGVEQRRNWRQMIHFISMAIISTAHGLLRIKFLLILFKGTLKECIILGYVVNRWLLATSHILKTYFRQKKTKNLMQVLGKSKSAFPGCYKRKTAYIVTGLLIFTAFLKSGIVAMQTRMEWPEWNIEDVVQFRSWEVGYNAFVWTKNPSNATEEYVDQRFFQVTTFTVILSIIAVMIDFIGIIHEQIIKGSIASNALTIFFGARQFSHELGHTKDVVPGKIPAKLWRQYRHLVELSQEINDIDGMVLGFVHADSFLLGAYFLDEALNPNIAKGSVFLLTYEVVKISGLYTALARSTSSTEDFRKWIIKHHSGSERLEIDDGSGSVLLYALLDELNHEPIGFKTSNVLINSAFNVQFVGAVVYYFLLLVDANSKEEK